MIKQLFLLVFSAVLFSSCLKSKSDACSFQESSVVAPSTEITALQNWVNVNAPGAIQHSSGVFYKIVNAGTGVNPGGVCSNITVKYTGTLLNGTKFDENQTGFTDALGRLIVGWQKGIPLVKAGGRIILYIPPTLGYGTQDIRDGAGNVVIPANSYLIFTVDLVSVQ
jgi:FKBP-type peptidyl-prolyl cis-trans isomerase FkpA